MELSMVSKIYNVLFICTANSARSIMAEAILNGIGQSKFVAYSAGSHALGQVHSYALEVLRGSNLSTDQLRSKSWDEYSKPDAPEFDFVITVCDTAAGEVCPIWAGQPMTSNWGVADPLAVEGTDIEKKIAFSSAFRLLNRRISIFASLPTETLDRFSLKRELDAIGLVQADPQAN
jgi:protein-tyrosine-phosphatase